MKELLMNGFCTFLGASFVIARMQGHPIVSNWIFLIWLFGGVTYYAIKSTKKENQR